MKGGATRGCVMERYVKSPDDDDAAAAVVVATLTIVPPPPAPLTTPPPEEGGSTDDDATDTSPTPTPPSAPPPSFSPFFPPHPNLPNTPVLWFCMNDSAPLTRGFSPARWAKIPAFA